jgi:uncharacterized membrane protein YcaP (DUF421 family)
MSGLELPNWVEVFVPDGSLLESFLRGSVVYLSLLVLFRLVLRRQSGSIGMPDVMLVVLISEAVSQGLTADFHSLPNALAVAAALLFWNFALDWLSHRWKWLRKLLEPEPLVLVRDGRPVREHLERERISDDELAAQLRLNGIDEVRRVKLATLEAEGEVSVVPAGPPRYDVEEATAKLVEASRVLRRALDWYRQQQAGPSQDRSSP